MLTDLSLFAIVVAVMLVIRKVSGWRIQSRWAVSNEYAESGQFSLKYLLVLTAFCAGLLVLGRSVAAGSFWGEPNFRQEFVAGLFLFGGTMLLALFPMLIIPLMAMVRRPSVRAMAVLPFLLAGLTWLAVEIIAAVQGTSRSDLLRQVALLQAGAAAAGLVSALVLRCVGFQLVRTRPEKSSVDVRQSAP
jgi:hypothetical protein